MICVTPRLAKLIRKRLKIESNRREKVQMRKLLSLCRLLFDDVFQPWVSVVVATWIAVGVRCNCTWTIKMSAVREEFNMVVVAVEVKHYTYILGIVPNRPFIIKTKSEISMSRVAIFSIGLSRFCHLVLLLCHLTLFRSTQGEAKWTMRNKKKRIYSFRLSLFPNFY